MISTLSGHVNTVTPDSVVIEVGGVGLLVSATTLTTAELHTGQRALLHTSLVVREDSLTLYGFLSADDRDVFQILQSVSGVGPRIAMAALSVYTADQLRTAVQKGDQAALTRIGGIGKKGAARLVLELADKLGPPRIADTGAVGVVSIAAQIRAAWPAQVQDALVGLGWSTREAESAIEFVVSEYGEEVPADRTDEQHVAAMLGAALRGMGARI
jgi:holliday junction DNA helicase RuvA